MIVLVGDYSVPAQNRPLGSGRYAFSFLPTENIDHSINITFNEALVPGAPFTSKICTGKKTRWGLR